MVKLTVSDEEYQEEIKIRRQWGGQIFYGRPIKYHYQDISELKPNRIAVKFAKAFNKWFKTLDIKELTHIGAYMSLIQYISIEDVSDDTIPELLFIDLYNKLKDISDDGMYVVTEDYPDGKSIIDFHVEIAKKILKKYGYEIQ